MKNLTIGTRLALGFFIVLALLVALSAIAVWRLQSASAMTSELINERIRNERLIELGREVAERVKR